MENKPVYKKDSIFNPSPAIAVVAYILIQFFLGAIFIYLIAWIYGSMNNMDFSTVIDIVSKPGGTFTEVEARARGVVNGYGNLLVYLSSTALVVFYMRDMLKEDFTDMKSKPKFLAWYIPVTMVGFLILTMLCDSIISQFVPASENQKLILDIMSSPGAIPMIISVVLLAPVVEELIYRKAIFHYTKKYKVWVSYLATIVLFTLPHMITTGGSIDKWLLQAIPYAFSAGLLAMVYHVSNYNIYTSIACHMANNLLAVIMSFISMGMMA